MPLTDFYQSEEELKEAAAAFGVAPEALLSSLEASRSGVGSAALEPTQPAAAAPVAAATAPQGFSGNIPGVGNVNLQPSQLNETALRNMGLTPEQIAAILGTAPKQAQPPTQPPLQPPPGQPTFAPPPGFEWRNTTGQWLAVPAAKQPAQLPAPQQAAYPTKAEDWLALWQTIAQQDDTQVQDWLAQLAQSTPDYNMFLHAITTDDPVLERNLQTITQARGMFRTAISNADWSTAIRVLQEARAPLRELLQRELPPMDKAALAIQKSFRPQPYEPRITPPAVLPVSAAYNSIKNQIDAATTTVEFNRIDTNLQNKLATPTLSDAERADLISKAQVARQDAAAKQTATMNANQILNAGAPGTWSTIRGQQAAQALEDLKLTGGTLNDYIRKAVQYLYGTLDATGRVLPDQADPTKVAEIMPQVLKSITALVAAKLSGTPLVEDNVPENVQRMRALIFNSLSPEARLVLETQQVNIAADLKNKELRGLAAEVMDAVKSRFPELGVRGQALVYGRLVTEYQNAKALNPKLTAPMFVSENPELTAMMRSVIAEQQLSAAYAAVDKVSMLVGRPLSMVEADAVRRSADVDNIARAFTAQTDTTDFNTFWNGIPDSTKQRIAASVKGSLDILSAEYNFNNAVQSWLSRAGVPDVILGSGDVSSLYRQFQLSGKATPEQFLADNAQATTMLSKIVEREKQAVAVKQTPALRNAVEADLTKRNVDVNNTGIQRGIDIMIDAYRQAGGPWLDWYNSTDAKQYRDSLDATATHVLSATAETEKTAKQKQTAAAGSVEISQYIRTLAQTFGVDPSDWNSPDINAIELHARDAYDGSIPVTQWINQNTWIRDQLSAVAGSLRAAQLAQTATQQFTETQRQQYLQNQERTAARPLFLSTMADLGASGREQLQLSQWYDEMYDEWKGRGAGQTFESWLRSLGLRFFLDLLPTSGGSQAAPSAATVYRRAID